METIKGDITKIKKGVIAHQVNMRGVAGAGVALAIRNAFPGWYEHYRKVYKGYKLGGVDLYRVTPDLMIASLFSQRDYGYGRKFTDYDALRKALGALKDYNLVYLPHGIGAGHGGGDWRGIYAIIASTLPQAILVKYKK